MKKFLLICVLILAAAICTAAQAAPFSSIDEFLSRNGGEFNNREEIVRLFNQERVRLGESFEAELWKYLGDDIEKHYWISAFLDWKEYLHGNKPLPELSFKIRQRGVELIGDTEDLERLGEKITFLRDLAVASYLAGKRDTAIEYKKQATPIFEKYYDQIGAYIGANSEYENCVYENLEKDPRICGNDNTTPEEKPVFAGILSRRAINLPKPVYPKELRKKNISGPVTVKVIIGFDGRVIFAEAIKGRSELFEVAVEAARKARFSPTLLKGKPVKVEGVIIYNFVK